MNLSPRSNRLDSNTTDEAYSNWIEARESVWWKKLLPVRAPYRWNLRRLRPGFTLDLGCGSGRSLSFLGGNGVGVDHNSSSVRRARERGYRAFTPEEFRDSPYFASGSFDSILLSHIAEHMTQTQVIALLSGSLHLLRPHGQVILLCPQEAGFKSDPTHVEFMDFQALRQITAACALQTVRDYSFPLPRLFGRYLRYNEFVHVARLVPSCSSPQTFGDVP